jgi:putative transposase
VTRLGTLRLRIARTRQKNFIPQGLEKFERRAADVALLIREAFLRGISTRQVGRIVTTFTGESISAQTVSKLTRDLDKAVRQFHQAQLRDEWAYLFLDGVSLRMRRPGGRKRVHMLVAYGVKEEGTRHLLAFVRSTGEARQHGKGCCGTCISGASFRSFRDLIWNGATVPSGFLHKQLDITAKTSGQRLLG